VAGDGNLKASGRNTEEMQNQRQKKKWRTNQSQQPFRRCAALGRRRRNKENYEERRTGKSKVKAKKAVKASAKPLQ